MQWEGYGNKHINRHENKHTPLLWIFLSLQSPSKATFEAKSMENLLHFPIQTVETNSPEKFRGHPWLLSLSPSLSIMAMIKYRVFFFIEWSKPLLEYQARLLHASRERQTMCIIQQYIFMHPFGKGLNLGGLVMLCIIWEVKKKPNRWRK